MASRRGPSEVTMGESPYNKEGNPELCHLEEGHKKVKETIPEVTKDVLSYVDAEKRIIVNEKYPKQTVVIRKQLPTSFKRKLQDLLRSNADIFAWTYADMIGIPRTIMLGRNPFNMEHKLNEYNHIDPVKQKKRGLAPKRNKATCKEVDEGYHQIQMVEGDEYKKVFFTEKEVFCYRKMPFGLKNTGATYQRLVDKTFDRLRSVNMKLNPKKCSFGVEEVLFLGYLITKQWIKASPSKVEEITDLKLPRTLKEIQILNGKLTALSRFLSKGVDRSLQFFKALKSCTYKKTIQWIAEAEEAFQKMKEYIEILPTVAALIKGKVLHGTTRGRTKLPEIGEAHTSSGPFCKKALMVFPCSPDQGQILVDFLAKTPCAKDKGTRTKKLEAANIAPRLETT
ncbi:hypothetical protein Tco_1203056 [Tanacetum coccineum]